MEKQFLYTKKSEEIFKKLLSCVGPESSFPETVNKYSLEKEIKFIPEFWRLISDLYDLLREEFGIPQQDFSYTTCVSIFTELCKQVLRKYEKRKIEIKEPLDKYLNPDDLVFCQQWLKETLAKTQGSFKVYLLTNLIVLEGLKSLEVGNVSISPLTEEFVNRGPEDFFVSSSLGLLGGLEKRKGKDFFEQNKDSVLLSVNVSGFHHVSEQSAVFEKAITEIKIVFAYLAAFSIYLENAEVKEGEEKVEFKMEEFKNNFFVTGKLVGLQDYYLHKIGEENLLYVDLSWSKNKAIYFDKKIIIDSKITRALEVQFLLSLFNTMMKRADNEELKNKIKRSLLWFHKARLEDDLTDKAINLFISIETLLSLYPDPTTAHTDELAENIAILSSFDFNRRYEMKCEFKKSVYPLRSSIIHHGESVNEEKHINELHIITCNYVWSLRGLIIRYEYIANKYGTKVKALREFFDREKLIGGVGVKDLLSGSLKVRNDKSSK